MSTEITITSTTIDINVTEYPITIEAPSGAYPLPTSVYSVFGRTGNVVAAEGDYTLTQLAGVTITSPSAGQALVYNGTSWVNNTESYVGTVTSVSATVPTGLTITGSPITTSGTLAFGLQTGYSIPTTASQGTWDTAYNRSLTSAAVTGTTTKTLTLNQQSGGTITASWTDDNTDAVTSVFGRTGAVVAAEGDYSLTQLSDVTLTTPTSGQSLTYNGTNWVNSNASASDNLIQLVRNNSGATMTAGTVVYINGALGNKATIAKALATSDATSAQTYGLVQANIANNADGYVVVIGDVNNLNTSSLTEGEQLYLSSTTAGAYTTVKQYAPNHLVYVGIVLRSHPTLGVIGVKIQNGYEMDELHNVAAQSPNNGDILQYVSSTNLWTKTAGSTTNISEGTNLYFTDTRARAAITLTTTGTSGAATYTSGVINIPQYQAALTNPVTGTGTTNTLPKFTAASTIGNSNITDTGSLITLGSNSFVNGSLSVGNNNPNGWIAGIVTSNSFTGGSSVYGNIADGTIQSAVTNTAGYFRSQSATAAASFTLANLNHFDARQATFGAGSAVTTQRGFWAGASLIGATNNYGFQGSIPSGTNRWNLYMDGTADNYLAGSLGIGTTSLTGYSLRLSKSLTGSTSSFATRNEGVVLSDVTADAIGFRNDSNTQAAAFTLTNYWHFWARQGSIGAGSAITNQYGYFVDSNMIGATNNFGFYGNIPSGTNNWNVFMNGTAPNFLSGVLNIGTTTLSGYKLDVNGTARFAGNSVLFQNTAGAAGTGYAMEFATNSLIPRVDFVVNGAYVGQLSASGTDMRFVNTTTGNLLFITNANQEKARITSDGSLGIGTTSLTGYSLRLNKQLTGNADVYGVANTAQAQSSATTTVRSFYSFIGTQATAYTLGDLMHYWAEQDTIGAGSTVTRQYGFYVHSSLTGATTNFGFYGNIASGTNRWNLYMNGTANNYMAGSLGIGATGLNGYNLRVSRNISGSVDSYGIMNDGQIQSSVTTSTDYFRTNASTQAASFTLFSLNHYNAGQGTFGASSVVTNQTGFIVASNMIGATNNFGFRGLIPSGTNRWNLYMDGTASNYMAGSLGIGTTSIGAKLQVNNAATVGTGSTAMTAINPIIFVDNGNAANGSIVIKSHSVGAGNVVGALRFASSPDGANYNYAGIEALSAASATVETLVFKISPSNGSAATSTEIMRINSNGLLIGTQTSVVDTKLVIGGSYGRGALLSGVIPSTITSTARYVNTVAQTAAATFTLTNLQHYFAEQVTFGAGSTVTNQFGFYVENNLIGATNNYAFFGNIASGTNRWNLYMSGSASNYMLGNTGVGIVPSYKLDVQDSNSAGIKDVAQFSVIGNGAAGRGLGILIGSGGSASAVQVVRLIGYQEATSATANAASFAIQVANSSGTLTEYLRINNVGGVGVGASTIVASARLQVDSTTQGFLPPRVTTTQKNAIATPAAGLMVYDTTLNQMSYYNGTTWINF